MHGVYAVGWPRLTQKRRWMAAVLACGDGGMLSHHSAAALWGIAAERPSRIDVSVRRRCELRRPGLRVRGRPTLATEDIGSRDGIPITAPARTLVDLATELDALGVERAVNEADKRDLIDPEALRAALGRYAGEPGVRLPELGLVVETDGLRYHRTPSAQARDAKRDRAHVVAGMTPLRFTHYEIRHESARVGSALVRVGAMLRKRIGGRP
jgi:hypothetical protein